MTRQNRNPALDPLRRFLETRRRTHGDRCGGRRRHAPRRDGRAFRAEHHLRATGREGDAPAHDEPFDVHLMIAPADPYLEAFAEAGARHDHRPRRGGAAPAHRSLQTIRALGKGAGAAINPATPVEWVAHVLDLVDIVLVMTVNPGFGGQKFIPACVDKVRAVNAMIAGRDIAIEVDGGIDATTAPAVVSAGATRLVAGRRGLSETGPRATPRTSRRSARRRWACGARWCDADATAGAIFSISTANATL